MQRKNLFGLWILSILITAAGTWFFAQKNLRKNSTENAPSKKEIVLIDEAPYKENEEPIEVPENLKDVAKTDVQEGKGKEVDVGSKVEIHYVGRLSSGKIIDSSRRRFQPYSFQIGHGEALTGLEMGVLGMKEGGRRRLIIPPQFGYGIKGTSNGFVPGNATLVYDVEVLKVSK